MCDEQHGVTQRMAVNSTIYGGCDGQHCGCHGQHAVRYTEVGCTRQHTVAKLVDVKFASHIIVTVQFSSVQFKMVSLRS